MKDFLINALPWVIIGCCLALLFAFRGRIKQQNYMTEGMCIGMCIGVALGSTGLLNLGIGVSLGLLVGLIAGLLIKKEKD